MPAPEAEGDAERRPADVAHQLYEVPASPGGAYRRRVAILGWCLVGIVLVLWLRLAHLQVIRGAECLRRCDSIIQKVQPLPAHRGTIRARDGRPLAIDEPAFDIALAYPCMVNDEEWIERRQRLHGISEEEVLRRIKATWSGLAALSATSEGDLRDVAGQVIGRVQLIKDHVSAARGRRVTIREERLAHPIIRDVDLAMVEQVLQRRDEWLGVEVQVRTKRRYPKGAAAAHVVGYMLRVRDRQVRDHGVAYHGDARRAYQVGEAIGAAGIEAARNFDLRGRRGWAQLLVNARGDIQETLERVEPEPGGDIVLSIDLDLQEAAEAVLAKACDAQQTTGAVVVLEVETGRVLALASYPAFDPAEVRKAYGSLAADPARPLINRVTAAHYPLGSVFKVVDSVAALQTGAITPAPRFVCEHRFRVGRRFFHCEGTHGEIEFTTALAKSCNIYFYQVALATGQSHLLAWAYRLGFGRPTGIELPGEIPGVLPPVNRHAGSTCNLAIGQGRLAVTPLQVATMMAHVANGGKRIRPTVLLNGARRDLGRLDLSPSTLAALRRALREVVTSGTARRVGFDSIMPVAGKTGTAEVGIAGREPHAWFAGYAPADRPEIAFAVLIEHGGHGGEIAAPLARDLLARYAALPLRLAAGSR